MRYANDIVMVKYSFDKLVNVSSYLQKLVNPVVII